MKQLELFRNLNPPLPNEEKVRLQKMASSFYQYDIDICCALLGVLGYNFTQKAAFVFEAQMNTIPIKEWERTMGYSSTITKSFRINRQLFTIKDGVHDFNKDIYLVVTKHGELGSHSIYNYSSWDGDEYKSKPTMTARRIQADNFKVLINYWNAI